MKTLLEPNLYFYLNKNKGWRKGLSEKELAFIKAYLYKKTEFPMCFLIPDKYLIQMFLRELKYNDIQCPVKDCLNFLVWFPTGSRFMKTCNCKDKVHNKFMSKIKQLSSVETCQKRYGVDNPSQVKEFMDKVRSTMLANYGVEHANQAEVNMCKLRRTNQLRYGVDYGMQAKEHKEKHRQTSQRNFGTDHPMQSEEGRELCKSAIQLRYGVDFMMQSDVIKGNLYPYLNIKNIKLLSKEHIEENFVDPEGHLMTEEIRLFTGHLSPDFGYRISREFGVEYIIRSCGGGFDPNKPGILYYIRDTINDLYKIGITNLSVHERFGSTMMEFIEIIETFHFEDGLEAYLQEQAYHKKFKEFRLNNERFRKAGGYTEFFKYDVLCLNNRQEDTASFR